MTVRVYFSFIGATFTPLKTKAIASTTERRRDTTVAEPGDRAAAKTGAYRCNAEQRASSSVMA